MKFLFYMKMESYTYDYAGNRQSKTGNENSTTYYVNDTSGSLTQIATAGNDVLYYQYNSLGDVISVLEQEGAVQNEYDYDAFGNAITEKETVSNPLACNVI